MFPEVLITDALGSPARPRARFLCAHGAGAGPQTPFLDAIADLLAARGVGTHRFAFGYMQARTAGGTRRPPPNAERLTGEYRAAAAGMPPGAPILIGGKSMGGRVASLIADELYGKGSIVGLVCLGYPFHPPDKPQQLRTAHLLALACPTLIVQGERDPFGTRTEVEALSLSTAIRVHWVRGGNHDFVPPRGSGLGRADNLKAAADAILAFITGIGVR